MGFLSSISSFNHGLRMKDLKPNWPVMTKKHQREKKLYEQQQTRVRPVDRKDEKLKRRGYFACM